MYRPAGRAPPGKGSTRRKEKRGDRNWFILLWNPSACHWMRNLETDIKSTEKRQSRVCRDLVFLYSAAV